MTDEEWTKISGDMRETGGNVDAGRGLGAHPFLDALKGVGHGAADLAYGAGQTLFPEGPTPSSNLLNPMTYLNKYAPSVKKYVDEPEKLDAEGVAREATDLLGPLAIPVGGEVEEGINIGARALKGVKGIWGRKPLLGPKTLEKVSKYVAPVGRGAAEGATGATLQPSKTGDQTEKQEVGATAGAARAAYGTLPWQAKYGLPALALMYEEAQRLTGGHGGFGSAYGLWHVPSALSALAGLVAPSTAGATAAQILDKSKGGSDGADGGKKEPF